MQTEDSIMTTPMEDPTLLLVSGSKGSKIDDKAYRKKLANAIVQVFLKHGVVRLRGVGAAANNNALLAYLIAEQEALQQNIILTVAPSFTNVIFNGETKTGTIMEILCLDDFVAKKKAAQLTDKN
jgi:stage V sporulation protein SpoVS